MKYYKVVKDGIIEMIGSGSKETTLFTPITEDKYEELQAIMKLKPDDTLEEKYLLDDETEMYIGIETTRYEKCQCYANAVTSGELTIDDVPEEFKADVESLLPQPEVNEESLDNAYRQGVNEA